MHAVTGERRRGRPKKQWNDNIKGIDRGSSRHVFENSRTSDEMEGSRFTVINGAPGYRTRVRAGVL